MASAIFTPTLEIPRRLVEQTIVPIRLHHHPGHIVPAGDSIPTCSGGSYPANILMLLSLQCRREVILHPVSRRAARHLTNYGAMT